MPVADARAALHPPVVSESTRPSIHDRLQRVLVVASSGLIVAIITTMWFTEQLPAAVRWPIVILLIFLVALVSASVMQRQVAELIEEPLARCVGAADAIARGDTGHTVPPAGTEEFNQLANAINRMTEQMNAATQTRLRVEKLATMGRIAAGISHEIGNPVSAIANYAHVLRMRTGNVAGTSEPLDALEREITRIDRIMRGLLDYARPRRLTPKPIVVDEVITDVLRLLGDQGITRRFRIDCELEAPDGKVYAERHDLEQVFVNLLLNAVDAMDREGEIVVRSRINDVSAFTDAIEKRRTDPIRQRWSHRPSRRALAWLARPESPPRATVPAGGARRLRHRRRPGRRRAHLRAVLLHQAAWQGHRPRTRHRGQYHRKPGRHDLGPTCAGRRRSVHHPAPAPPQRYARGVIRRALRVRMIPPAMFG